MSKFFTKKTISFIIGSIILGAIGSGVWEKILSPFFSFMSRSFLTITTLGVDSFKDSIYIEIAKGHHEKPSLILYQFMITIILMVPVLLFTLHMMPKKKAVEDKNVKAQLEDIYKKIEEEQKDKTEVLKRSLIEFENIKKEFESQILDSQIKQSKLEKKMKFCIIVLFLSGAHIFSTGITENYVNRTITNFNQCLTIVSPFISPEVERNFKAEFASIKSKIDYEKLIDKIKICAASNKVQLPEYSIW